MSWTSSSPWRTRRPGLYAEKGDPVARDAVDQDRQKLAAMIEQNPSAEDRQALQDFNRSWADYQPLQEQILALGQQNSNYKAHQLLRGKLADKLGEYEAAVNEALHKADKDIADAVSDEGDGPARGRRRAATRRFSTCCRRCSTCTESSAETS